MIDGGSRDGTLDVLATLLRPAHDLSSERDNGQVDAINKGLRAATGDIIGWVNSDDVLLPGALARVVSALAVHPEAEWLHGRCEIIDQQDRPVRKWVSLYKHLRARRHTFENLLTENTSADDGVLATLACHDRGGLSRSRAQARVRLRPLAAASPRGAPLYLDERLACFRWYPTSKSGAQFEAQFREDAEVAARYAEQRPWLALRKRAKNLAIVSIYRMLAAGRWATSGRGA